MMRRILLLPVLLALSPARGGEADPAPFVEALGAKDYGTREAATLRLFEMGEAARSVLEKAKDSPDPEVRERAQLLLSAGPCVPEYLDVLTPRRLAGLRGPDPSIRQAIAEEILTLGDRGLKALTMLYDSAPLSLKIRPLPGRRTFFTGEDVDVGATVRNLGPRAGWATPPRLTLEKTSASPLGREAHFEKRTIGRSQLSFGSGMG